MENRTNTSRAPRILLVVGPMGVLLGVLFGSGLLDFQGTSRPKLERPDPKILAAPHLNAAKVASEKCIDGHVDSIRLFFADSKKNTRRFAEIALGWGSKWKLITDNVPFSKGGEHEIFIRDQFEQTVFSVSSLESVVSLAVAEYLAEIRSIENQMLVALRADLAGIDGDLPLAKLDDSQLRSKFDQAIENAIAAASGQLRADVGTQLVSLIVGEVLTQVAIRLGASAAILTAGGSSIWLTMGIGFVVGVIVDQIVSWVWDWWADPKGELARKIDLKLDEMCTLICDGGTGVQGLRERFQSIARERARLRETAILELLSGK